jgi:hypothetical protein
MSGLTGKLLLGVADNTISNPDCRLAEVVGRFHAAAPAVETHLSIRPPSEIVEEILMRRLDFAVLAIPSARFKLAAEPLFDEEFRLYTRRPALGRLSLGQLAAGGFAVATREGHWQSEALADQLGLAQRGVGRGLEAAAILIASGRYVGFLPTHLVGPLQPRYPLVEVERAEHLRYVKTFSLVYDPARPFSAAGTTFAQIARQVHGSYRGLPATGMFEMSSPEERGEGGMAAALSTP